MRGGAADRATVTRAVRDCVRAAMQLEQARPARWSWPSGLGEADFVNEIIRQRVLQVVGDHAAALELPCGILQDLQVRQAAENYRALLQASEMTRVVDVLSGAGIDVLCFKGPVLSLVSTGQLHVRGPGDLDLLVAPDRVAAAAT